MEPNSLYEEQLQYIRSRKEEMFAFLKDVKLGFDLNFPIYFACLTQFELHKKYTIVCEEFKTDKFLTEEYHEIMDSVWVNPRKEEDFSIKKSLKAEVRLSVITNYMKEIESKKKKIYPSEILRKEKVFNNVIKRAHKKIDAYFKSRDVMYREVCDVMDIFEIIVRDNGKLVDFHYGGRGLSLSGEHSSEELLAQAIHEREEFVQKQELVKVRSKKLQELMEIANSEGIYEEYEIGLSALSRKLPFSEFAIRDKSMDQLNREMDTQELNLKKTITFFRDLKMNGQKLPERTKLNFGRSEISIGHFNFMYSEKNVQTFMKQYHSYIGIESFIDSVVTELNKVEVNINVSFESNTLKITAAVKNSIENLIRGVKQNNARVSMVLNCVGTQLYRVTGEEVLTSEVVVYEMKEKIRDIDKTYLKSVEKAKKMFIATLTEEEEKLMLEENITILEGEQNYYALLNAQTYNNVVKIPKELKSLEDIKSLCIHPEDSSVPMYDGFAAITFAVKAGDEEYVLENSNEFGVATSVKNKIVEVFNSFIPNHNLNLNCLFR